MPQFSYKAKNLSGTEQSGYMKAKDRVELAALLKQKGLILSSAQKRDEKKGHGFKLPMFSNKVGLVDKMLFTRNLSVMLRAGLPFERALTILSEQTKSKYFKEVLVDVASQVERGEQLANSLEKYPLVFNKLFVSMVRVGETGGNLEEVLDLLAIQIKKDYELTSKVKGAMTYPCVILIAMVIVGTLMMIFVFPNLLNMFAESGAELPLATKMLIFISNSLVNYGLYILIAVVLGIYALLDVARTTQGKKTIDGLFLKLPVVGDIVMKVNVARFCRTLSSMIASGVSIVEALSTVSSTLGNYYFSTSTMAASEQVQKGVELSAVMKGYGKLYPSMMIHMIEVGEETGSIEKTLKQVAEFYEDEVDQFTSNLSSVIEPVLMLLMGAVAGVFVIALIQPMYSIMETI
jgi:type IV pilus assembly protein PilC